MTTPTESCFIFIVKTDSYAGNFERPMCGFMTGVLGDCGVGDIAAGLYGQQCPDEDWSDKLVQVADEHGCHRPVSIWGYGCFNDVAIFLENRPTEQEIEFLRKRAMLFILDPRDGVGHSGDDGNPRIKIKGFELVQYDVTVDQQEIGNWPPMDVLKVLE